ncbi:hypothetical protein A6R68_06241, partial [Neotoma lepida]
PGHSDLADPSEERPDNPTSSEEAPSGLEAPAPSDGESGRYEESASEDKRHTSDTYWLNFITTPKNYDKDRNTGSQNGEKWNQEHFVLTFPQKPLPVIKKRSGSSETQIAVPRQEKRKTENGQKPTDIWINQFFQELFLRPPFALAFITQAPFKYLYRPRNHYIMAETRKPKDDITRTTLKKNLKEKTSSCAVNLESNKKMTDGNPEISSTENVPSKLSHKIEPFKKSNAKSETNIDSNNSKITMEMDSRNDNEDLINSKEANNEAKFWKDNPNTNSKTSIEEFSDDTVECISSSNIDLMFLNAFRAESIDFDKCLTNCSQNNAKKPVRKGAKKEKDFEPEFGDLKDIKKEGKKKEKKEPKKKKDAESTDDESGDSKDAKKESKKDKKEKKETKKKKDTDSVDAESGDFKGAKKNKKEKKEDKKDAEAADAEYVTSKDAKKENTHPKKDNKKGAVHTDSESDAELKKGKKVEKKESNGNKKKAIKDTESTDADSESEGDPRVKKGEKKDKKITKKGEKKDAKKNISSASESEFEVKKEKKEAVKGSKKERDGNYTDSASDASSKAGIKRDIRPSDTESEGSSGFKVLKTSDDSDATSTDSKKGTSELKKGFRAPYKKTTFSEKGTSTVAGRIPSSRKRPPFPPCEHFREPAKPKCVCQCKMPPPPPKPRYAPLESFPRPTSSQLVPGSAATGPPPPSYSGLPPLRHRTHQPEPMSDSPISGLAPPPEFCPRQPFPKAMPSQLVHSPRLGPPPNPRTLPQRRPRPHKPEQKTIKYLCTSKFSRPKCKTQPVQLQKNGGKGGERKYFGSTWLSFTKIGFIRSGNHFASGTHQQVRYEGWEKVKKGPSKTVGGRGAENRQQQDFNVQDHLHITDCLFFT